MYGCIVETRHYEKQPGVSAGSVHFSRILCSVNTFKHISTHVICSISFNELFAGPTTNLQANCQEEIPAERFQEFIEKQGERTIKGATKKLKSNSVLSL